MSSTMLGAFIAHVPDERIHVAGDSTPPWLEDVLRSAAERWGEERGWDGEAAEPTSIDLFSRLVDALQEVMRDDLAPPVVTPLADGGVQAEWHGSRRDLEITVSPDEPARYYFFDGEREESGNVATGKERLPDLIRLFE